MLTLRITIVLMSVALMGTPTQTVAAQGRFQDPQADSIRARALARLQALPPAAGLRRVELNPDLGTPRLLEFSADQRGRRSEYVFGGANLAHQLGQFLAQELAMDSGPRLALTVARIDTAPGMLHLRYRQTVDGFTLAGFEALAHLRRANGGYVLESVNARIAHSVDLPSAAALPAAVLADVIAGANPRFSQVSVDSGAAALSVIATATGYRLVARAWGQTDTSVRMLTVDAATGQILGDRPGARYAATPPTSAIADITAVETESTGARESTIVGYQAVSGTDVHGQSVNFRVYDTGSGFELRSDELGWGVEEIIIRNTDGAHIGLIDTGNGCTRFSTVVRSLTNEWTGTNTLAREEVSAMFNAGLAGRFYKDSLNWRSYDNALPGSPLNVCIRAYAGSFSAVATEQTGPAIGFIGTFPPNHPSSAARDVVTHEFTHLVAFHLEASSYPDGGESEAIFEGLADYFGTRQTGNSCVGAEALASGCLRDLNTVVSHGAGAQSGDKYTWGLALAGALWDVGKLSPALGHDIDRATFDAMRFYTGITATMVAVREGVIRAWKDRVHANLNLTNSITNLEQEFAGRGIGHPPVTLFASGSQVLSCGYRLEVSTGGPRGGTSRTYSVLFQTASGSDTQQNNDGSVANVSWSTEVVPSGTRTDGGWDFGAFELGGHSQNDGHAHAFRVRFTDMVGGAVGWHDYYAGDVSAYCEEFPMGPQSIAMAGLSGRLPPHALIARQRAGTDGLQPALSGAGADGGSLVLAIARTGITALDYGVPVASAGRQVTIDVHDASGRRVRRLLHEPASAGWKTAQWDALDDHGRRVGPGAYTALIRLDGSMVRVRLIVPQD